MKVLITGATGLVGSHLVRLLQEKGADINYLTTSKDKLISKENYKGYHWDPEKGLIDENCFIDVDCIIHLAGASISRRWTQSYKQEILESRVNSANILYEALKVRQHNVTHFISASAIGIYPDSLNNRYTENEQEVDQSFLGDVVKKWEAAARQIESLNIKVAIVRTGIVLSGKGGALPQMALPVKLGLGSAFGSGRQMQSWIHIEDLVNIYLFIYTTGIEGTYNAVAPHPVSNDALTHSMAKVLNKPYFMPHVPRFIMKGMLGEMHMLLFSSQNVSAQKIVNHGFTFRFPVLDEALKDVLL